MRLKVNSCCGCFDLHTGTLIIGICGILFSGGGIMAHIFGLDDMEDDTTKEEIQIGIGYSYLYVIVNVLLIYGAIKESRYFLLPWLIYVALGLGVFTLAVVISALFAPILIFVVFIAVGLWYVWLCVLSYYNEINPTNPPPTNITSPIPTMAPTVVTYVPQAPAYVGSGPQVV